MNSTLIRLKTSLALICLVIGFQIFNVYPSQADSTYTSTAISSIPIFNTFSVRTNFKGSSDGTKIIAASAGLYLSTNSGVTFTSIVPSAWSATASKISSAWISEDGRKIVAVQNPGNIAVSTDAGVTWTYEVLNKNFIDVSASADMQKIYVITNLSTLYTSTNFGSTWSYTSTGGAGNPFTSGTYGSDQGFISVQSSADGMNVQIVGRDDFYRSQDGGATWTSTLNISGRSSSCCFYSAMSQSGQVVVVSYNGNGFYLSKDYGSTFTQIPMASFNGHPGRTVIYGYGSGVSQDGTHLVLYDFGKYVYISSDGGATWEAQADLGVNSWAGGAYISNSGVALVQSNLAANWITGASGITYLLSNGIPTPRITPIDPDASARETAAKREAEIQAARTKITSARMNGKDISAEMFAKADIGGITQANIASVLAEISALPQSTFEDITQVLKVARKYEVVGLVASEQISWIYPNTLVEIGLISQESKFKSTLTASIRKLPLSERSSYAALKKAISQKMAEMQVRKDRLNAVLARMASHRGQ